MREIKLYIGAGLLALTLMGCQQTISERPPTFDELMALADKNLAKTDLIKSYIYSQKDGVGFQNVMAQAETGDTKAELMACYLLITGTGVEENDSLGYDLCEKAAEKGSAPAKANLIYRDFNDDPEHMNWQETYDAFEDMLKSDPSIAHRGMQFLYRQNHPKASGFMMYYHLNQAIKYKNTNAMLALSEIDLHTRSKRNQNPKRAEKNLKRAYRLNDFDAGFKLALEYREGRILEQNTAEYVSMIKHMAAFLHPQSMGELASIYQTGNGAEQDEGQSQGAL